MTIGRTSRIVRHAFERRRLSGHYRARSLVVQAAAGLSDECRMTEVYAGPDRRGVDDSERRSVVDRRSGMERRRGPGRRRCEVRRNAEEGEITGELLEFVMAIDEYKRVNERPFPTWSEVFEIIQYLGYRKVAERAEHINSACDSTVLESLETAGRAL
jgi:hypothetical protein